jgi:hypothetical protein
METPKERDNGMRFSFERFLACCMLCSVVKLTKVVAMLTLVVYGVASMHCVLEGVPGLGFLQTCCFVDSAPSAPQDCESDGCSPVEGGKYRPEEQTASAPQPRLVLALLSAVIEARLPELQSPSFLASESPPELPRVWQFSQRTALPPRPPSPAS